MDKHVVDHKQIGQEQDLFLVSQEVGSGFPLFAPKGLLLRREVENYIVAEKEKRGYVFVWSPHIAKSDIYKKSGHWQKYEAMFPPIKLDDEAYVLKPMNCPHHFQVYLNRPRSYRELPLRIAENGTVYRYEKSGEVNGLLRVRSLTIDDTHSFVRYSQIPGELDEILDLIEEVFKVFGFGEYRARISVRDPKDHSKYIGDPRNWDKAEKALVDAAKKRKMHYELGKGEAAFYGPKIDVMVKDSLGREWQLSTAQLDFNQPENFDMSYINEKGESERPAILHIAILGSIERFLGVVIEHFAGAFPVWLSPVQVKILPVGEAHLPYALSVFKELKNSGFRVELDGEESLPKRIRDAELQKIPYIVVVGGEELKEKSVAVRIRGKKDHRKLSLPEFEKQVLNQIHSKSLSL